MTRFDPFHDIDYFLTQSPRTAAMPMDLYRDGETFVAAIDLPGVEPDTIDIDVDGGTLTVRAERKPVSVQGAQWLSRERVSGTYARQLSLGSGLALDRIQAEYADGVLTITIPVAEEAKPRRISVNHAGNTVPVGSGTDEAEGSPEA